VIDLMEALKASVAAAKVKESKGKARSSAAKQPAAKPRKRATKAS
jgi:non-homologous end joining protein Ku